VKTIIYYFSGTGNSLVVARDIAEKSHGELVSVPSVMDKEIITTDADVIGIVFPVYYQSIPCIIKRFVSILKDLDNKYIFGICTYGDSPSLAVKQLDDLLKLHGGKLAAGFAVNMPYNYLTPSFGVRGFFKSFTLREISKEKQQELFTSWKKKLESIDEIIRTRKEGIFETRSEPLESLIDTLHLKDMLQKALWLRIAGYEGKAPLPFLESKQLMDYGFRCDETCNGCKICSRICPVMDIKMVDGKPTSGCIIANNVLHACNGARKRRSSSVAGPPANRATGTRM
jgi:flavodoxin/ferredoxin